MKKTLSLTDCWEQDGNEYACAFDVDEDFQLTCVYLDIDDLEAGAEVVLNGVEVGVAGKAQSDRFKVSDAIHVGPNELVVRSSGEQTCPAARLVSCDKVSIERVRVEPEIVDNSANVWVSIDVANHTNEKQHVLASVVLAQVECRERVEMAEFITPFGGMVEAVIRIVDPSMWEPSESGVYPSFDCLIGLQVDGEVMDVGALRFDFS